MATRPPVGRAAVPDSLRAFVPYLPFVVMGGLLLTLIVSSMFPRGDRQPAALALPTATLLPPSASPVPASPTPTPLPAAPLAPNQVRLIDLTGARYWSPGGALVAPYQSNDRNIVLTVLGRSQAVPDIILVGTPLWSERVWVERRATTLSEAVYAALPFLDPVPAAPGSSLWVDPPVVPPVAPVVVAPAAPPPPAAMPTLAPAVAPTSVIVVAYPTATPCPIGSVGQALTGCLGGVQP